MIQAAHPVENAVAVRVIPMAHTFAMKKRSMRKAMDSIVAARITPQALAIAAAAHITPQTMVSAARMCIVQLASAAKASTVQCNAPQ